MKVTLKAGLALTASLFASMAMAQTQGVTKDSITLGTIQDLSGPLAAYGKQTRNGLQMYFDEMNARGGVAGRKVSMVVEDSGYDPRKALLAAQKLVNSDKIFLMVAHLGTAQNMAAMPVQFEKNVINFMPVTAARSMYLPADKLKVAFAASYYDQVLTILPEMMKERKFTKPCVIYQDDEFGLEVVRGGDAALAVVKQSFVEKTSFKRGATEFSSQVAKMKSSGCDVVLMGTIIRETVGVLAEAKKIGLDAFFLGTSAAYTHLIPALGGPVAEGFTAMMTTGHPYADDPSPQVREWAARYKTKFNEDATVFSAYGWQIAYAFEEFAKKAGTDLTVESFLKAVESTDLPKDMFDMQGCKITPANRLCDNSFRLSTIKNGRWVIEKGWVKGATPTN